MINFLSKIRRERSSSAGQTTVVVAAALTVLLGCAGLAVDIGNLRNTRQRMQTAADSAAIAAVEGMQTDQWSQYGQKDATSNGFKDGSNGVSVSITNPPASGAYKGNAQYVQVAISEPAPTYFLRVLGLTTVNLSVSASGHLGNS